MPGFSSVVEIMLLSGFVVLKEVRIASIKGWVLGSSTYDIGTNTTKLSRFF